MTGLIALVIASICAAQVVGCRGEAPRYSMGATYACLADDGYDVTYNLDDTGFSGFFEFDAIAREAGGGALATPIGESFVVVAFERSEGDAKQTEEAYNSLRPDAGNRPDVHPVHSVERIVERSRNAVAVWAKPPTDQASAALGNCLRE